MRSMDKDRFEFLARRLRSTEPAISAARLVLMHGISIAEAVKATGIKQPSLSRSLKSFRELDEEIKKIYCNPKKPIA
ncbi:hypothetical protein ACLS0R_07495 [Comamonas jiangduensis]|uniref:hypothetical protein n=1 Tax=Comamonas jiangduensis TaxID=1194168 RepID=UPI003BF7B2AE